VTNSSNVPPPPLVQSGIGDQAELWATWLYEALRCEMIEGRGPEAYGAYAATVLAGDTLSDGLRRVANSLGTIGNAIFAEACPKVLERLDFSDKPQIKIATVILELSRAVGATRSLRELARKANKFPVDQWPGAFFQVALELTRVLALNDGANAAALLRHLVTSAGNFPIHQSSQTLVALATAAPEDIANHWNLLSNYLEQALGNKDGTLSDREEKLRHGRRKDLLDELIARVPQKKLLSFRQLTMSADGAVIPQWWLDTLAQAPDDVREAIRSDLNISTRSPMPTFQGNAERTQTFQQKDRVVPSWRRPSVNHKRSHKSIAEALGFKPKAVPNRKITVAAEI
jgi:hypothetical protein